MKVKPPLDPRAEAERWRAQLRRLIARRGHALAEVDRALGWGRGSTSRLLRPGGSALKVEQAIALVGFLGAELGVYFRELAAAHHFEVPR